MSPDLAALLAAICDPANDADDGLRLAYADLLEEEGERGRAEFVRVQVELARDFGLPPGGGQVVTGDPVADAREARLRRRERELLDVLKPYPLLPGVPFLNATWAFSRGFISRVRCTAADWLAHADAITARQPVRDVRLTTWPVLQVNNLHYQTYPPGANCRYRLADGRGHDEGDDWRHGRMRDMDPGTADYEAAVLPLFCGRWPHVKFTLPTATAADFAGVTGAQAADYAEAGWMLPSPDDA